MANKIQYIDNVSGDHIFPVTHERGVLDDEGVSIGTKITQLGQEVDGYTESVQVAIDTYSDGYGISNSGQITSSSRQEYSVALFRMEYGKTYHLTIPKLTNSYTVAYGFFTKNSSYISETITLPSSKVVGPIENYGADVTAPSETLIYLVACYETDYGQPSLVGPVEHPGLVERVETLEEKETQTESAIAELEETVNDIIEDTTITVYEKEGQIEYYQQSGTFYGWSGTAIYTPYLSESALVNRVIFPPFKSNSTALAYLVGYADSTWNGKPSDMNIIAQGKIAITPNVAVIGYEVSLSQPIEIPASNKVWAFIYSKGYDAEVIGGSKSATELPPFSADDPTVYFTSTGHSETPFDMTWSRASDTTTARYKGCCPILKYIEESEVGKIVDERLDEVLPNKIADGIAAANEVKVYLPDKLYAVVGDTLELFFQSVVGVINIGNYDIYAQCTKGKTYPRYFSYTPTAADIGTATLTIYVKDRNNNILGQASCDLVTVSAPSSPVSAKSIFTFGDSLTSQGQWPGEAKRRLVGNSTYDSITGKGLSNLAFYGYMNKTINGQSVNYFGVGGWTWANYLTKGTGGAFRFNVSGVSSLSLGAVYTNNGYSYTIQEINITGDSGNIRCTTSANTNTPYPSGTLTKTSGDGDATITFTSYETENANPLWDDANNKMSFIPYVQDCGASTIDAVYVLLSWNGQQAWKEYSADDETGPIANAKTFARTLHTEYPSAKLFIMGLQMPSETGGLGYNYGASGGYIDGYGLKKCALNYNKALQELCNLDEFSPYCEFVAIAPQFDSLYNMPYSATKVNIRNSVTERIGRNGVHPSDAGYFQIADAVYRSIVANFCQH